jgi:hypothetical protein
MVEFVHIRRVVNITNWIWRELGTISLLESCTEDGIIIVDVRDLCDVERDVSKVKKKILIVSNLLGIGCRVAVRCIGGINRSNSIAISVMCFMNPHGSIDETWEHHFNVLKAQVNRAHITPELERTCKKALKELVRDFRGFSDQHE